MSNLKARSMGYKLTRTKTNKGMLYTVIFDDGSTVNVMKYGPRLWKPVGRNYFYVTTQRDAIMQVVMNG